MTESVQLPRRVRRDGPIRFFFDEDTLGIGQVMAIAPRRLYLPGS